MNLSEAEYKELTKLAEESQISMARLGRQGVLLLLEQFKFKEHQLTLLDAQPKRVT